MKNGTLVLVYNPDDKNWGARNPISLTTSKDNGKTWLAPVDLEKGIQEDEFSYPSIIGFGDTVAITWTWKRKFIAFCMATVK